MTTDTRRALQFLAKFAGLVLACWVIVVGIPAVIITCALIQFLYFMGSVPVSIPAS